MNFHQLPVRLAVGQALAPILHYAQEELLGNQIEMIRISTDCFKASSRPGFGTLWAGGTP